MLYRVTMRNKSYETLLSGYRQTTLLYSTHVSNPQSNIHVGVLIERQPIITSKKNILERDILSLQEKAELLNSYKSNYELQKDKESEKTKLSIHEYTGKEFDIFSRRSTKDLEEWNQKESNNLHVIPRTGDSKRNQLCTQSEKFDESLFLINKKRTEFEKEICQLPNGIVFDGEPLKQAAKRILSNCCGDNSNIYLYGNTPIGIETCNTYNAPKSCKIFFFLARYMSATVNRYDNYQWLNFQELQNILSIRNYKNIVNLLTLTK